MSRKHEREKVAIEARLEKSSEERETVISNLSLGGCYVESVTEFALGEPVSFDLIDPSGGTVGFTGQIAHVIKGQGFGLQFTNLRPDQISFLKSSFPDLS